MRESINLFGISYFIDKIQVNRTNYRTCQKYRIYRKYRSNPTPDLFLCFPFSIVDLYVLYESFSFLLTMYLTAFFISYLQLWERMFFSEFVRAFIETFKKGNIHLSCSEFFLRCLPNVKENKKKSFSMMKLSVGFSLLWIKKMYLWQYKLTYIEKPD